MKSYSQIISETFKNKKTWNYYSGDSLNKINPFKSVEDSKEFIKNFIVLSHKAEANSLYKKIDKLGDRALHVVSTYFLGIYLYESSFEIKNAIDNAAGEEWSKKEFTSNIKFSYMWYLICLFHDLGYEFENGSTPKYNSLSEFLSSECLKGLIRPATGVPKLYESIYESYFNFRAVGSEAHSGKNDHGICAAHVLFTDLCKIRNEQENSDKKSKILNWEKPLENIYNFAAWIILAHNIWYAKKADKCTAKSYKAAGLKKLIIQEGDYKIILNQNPFLFLFCLVDTIEPLKRVKDVALLEKILIGIEDDKITVESKLSCGCHDIIINQANSLNSWLTTTRKNDNTVEIDFTPRLIAHGANL